MYFFLSSTANLLGRDLNRLAFGVHTGRQSLLERAVDEVVRPSIEANFQASGRPEWEPLAQSTLERRERAGLGDRPLIASGAGMDAALSRERWTVTSREATYPGAGWSGPGAYIRHHQEGAEDGHFPARPYVQLQPEDARALDRVGLAWLDGTIGRVGF